MPTAATQYHRKLCDAEYVQALVDRLFRLATESDPSRGAETEQGKDLRAFTALRTAGELSSALAGWAIRHSIGLAKAELAFVPLQPTQTKTHEEYLDARSKADSHKHEAAGAALGKISETRIIKKSIINLLRWLADRTSVSAYRRVRGT
jgi:hypothetical protein